MHLRKQLLTAAISSLCVSSAWATNGMNLEGYGPEALGMGGASFAYDNGTAATMNNPATLGLMNQGARLDLAIGFLGPDVDSTATGMGTASSGGDAYFMPAFGYARKNGALTYGVAVFAQGGMGTEYNSNTWLGMMTPPTGPSEQRSEVAVGRAMIPVAYNVNDKLTIGGTVDLVWAGMDLIMSMGGGQLQQMTAGGLVTGALAPALPGFNANDIFQFDFSNGSDFTGEAMGYGMAGKLGLTYALSDTVTFGATYHSKTRLSDLKATGAYMHFTDANNVMGGLTDISGTVKIIDFEWPETYGLGLAFQATDKLMLAMDVKRIRWSETMKDFKLSFTADPGFGGGTTYITMPQNWDDQNVFSLGAAYAATKNLTLRIGANISDNPIPNNTLNPLFPAIIEEHYTAGFSYLLGDGSSEVTFALSHAPDVKQTNTNALGPGVDLTTSHSQTSWQLMYSMNF